MSKDLLNEREFELINIVGANLAQSQRDLSRQMNQSLGMTNMLLRRMVAKGYIRIKQLNQRKVQYILTPKGFTEKMRESVKYIQKTMRSMNLIKSGVRDIVVDIYNQGEVCFAVMGTSDLAALVEMVIREVADKPVQIIHVEHYPSADFKGTLFICQENADQALLLQYPIINIVEQLAKEHVQS